MNFIKALNWRYAVRKFSEEVAPEQLQYLLDTGAQQKKARFDERDMITLL